MLELRKTGQFFGETRRQKTVSGLFLSENSYLPDQVTPRHTHEAMLLYLVLDGFCLESVTRSRNTHQTSTLVFLTAGEAHSTHWLPESPGRCFHLELDSSFLQGGMRGENFLPHTGSLSYSGGTPAVLMRRLHTELARWDSHSALIAEGIVLELLGEVGRMYTSRISKAGNWLSTVEACLREHWDVPPTLAQLADLADVHPSHLLRVFRDHYHVTPGEFVRRLRIEEACRLLRRNPPIPLSVLARDLGFADQSHFSRTFRRVIGTTPGLYRKMHDV